MTKKLECRKTVDEFSRIWLESQPGKIKILHSMISICQMRFPDCRMCVWAQICNNSKILVNFGIRLSPTQAEKEIGRREAYEKFSKLSNQVDQV